MSSRRLFQFVLSSIGANDTQLTLTSPHNSWGAECLSRTRSNLLVSRAMQKLSNLNSTRFFTSQLSKSRGYFVWCADLFPATPNKAQRTKTIVFQFFFFVSFFFSNFTSVDLHQPTTHNQLMMMIGLKCFCVVLLCAMYFIRICLRFSELLCWLAFFTMVVGCLTRFSRRSMGEILLA